jgi:hypothetical protein
MLEVAVVVALTVTVMALLYRRAARMPMQP